MKKVALIIDHPARDLDYICDIGVYLKKKGIRVVFVPSNMRHRELLLLKPNYILYPNHRDTATEEINILAKLNIKIGVLETEQCVNEKFFEKFQLPKNLEFRDDIDHFFVWGKYLSDISINKKWYKKKQVKITGSPKHDRNLTSEKNDGEKDYDLLIATSFPNSNPLFGEEVNRKTYQDLGMKNNDIDKFTKLHKENSLNTVNFINNYLGGTNLKILLRVHPYEQNIEFYKKVISANNVTVDESKDTILTSLNNSKVLLHYNSTACVDAQLVNVPSINMSWMPYLKVFHESTSIMSHISYQPATPEDCLKRVKQILNDNLNLKIQNNDADLHYYMHNLDGKSSERCANYIKDSIESSGEIKSNYQQDIFQNKFSLKGFIISMKLKKNWKKSKKFFSREDIEKSLKYHNTQFKSSYVKVSLNTLTSIELL